MFFELLPGKYQKLIYRLWKYAKYGTISAIVYLLAVNFNLFWLFGGMPSLKQLENPESELASEVISSDGEVLGKFFFENRSLAEYHEIPTYMVEALVATEDARFTEHSGIDLRSWGRVAFGVLTFNRSGGGSTLTQQLAKNLFSTREDKYRGGLGRIPILGMLIIKTKEWITAIKLERRYTKQEILTMYLNTVDFGSGAMGIKSAAKTYFAKEVKDLSVEEAALLVGIVQAPTRWNPKLHPENAKYRRNIVLGQMKEYGYLKEGAFNYLKEKPIKLKYAVENQNSGLAPYFREFLRGYLKNWLKTQGKEVEDLYTEGYKIYTTVDSRMQRYAEDAVSEHMRIQQAKFDETWKGRNPWVQWDEQKRTFVEMPNFVNNAIKRSWRYQQLKKEHGEDESKITKIMRTPVRMRVFSYRGDRDTLMSPIDSIKYYKRFLNIGFMAMDPIDGGIKAWVGGTSFKYFKYDHVQQSTRQPGSTFKPFVYATAIENGFSTCQQVTDQPITFGAADGIMGSWTPKNSDGRYSYNSLTLRQALGKSINTVSAYLIKEFKPDAVVSMARRLGITTPLDATPSLCLGVSDVSVFEMVAAYCTFANKGKLPTPYFITRIEDKNGNEVARFDPDIKEVLSQETAYKMIHLMKGATQGGGTAMGLSRYGVLEGNEVAAKTGTTSLFSDGWFMGITPSLVAGVWVGGDDRAIHFRSINEGQGARVAMPAWGLFMQKVYADPKIEYKKGTFLKPSNLSVSGDCVFTAGENADLDSTQYVPPKIKVQKEEEDLLE